MSFADELLPDEPFPGGSLTREACVGATVSAGVVVGGAFGGNGGVFGAAVLSTVGAAVGAAVVAAVVVGSGGVLGAARRFAFGMAFVDGVAGCPVTY